MKFLIIGAGNMGCRRFAHLQSLGHDAILMGREASDVNKWSPCNGVFICTPPDAHLRYAKYAIALGLPTFIEKPLGLPTFIEKPLGLPTFIEKPLGLVGEIAQWQEITTWANKYQVPVQVGYTLRHHEAATDLLSAVLQDQPYAFHATAAYDVAMWYPDYRRNHVCLPQVQGGGVISELSHELDLALWLFGPPQRVQCVTANRSWCTMQAENVAAITLQWSTGLIGQIHLDCLSPQYRRNWTLYGDRVREIVFDQQATADALRDETESFCKVVEGDAVAMPNGADGLTALRLIARIQEASCQVPCA